MTYVVDFDDLCDASAHTLAALDRLKAKYPDLVVTLFTIPNRTSPALIEQVKEKPWIALAPHGWEHTKGECLSWSYQEAKDKIMAAAEKGIDAPVFRAPAWLINGPTYRACGELGLVVASHREYHLPSNSLHPEDNPYEGVRQYIYNSPLGRPPKVRACHGHLTPVMDNCILDLEKRGTLAFPTKAEFGWPWDNAVLIKSQEGAE